MGNEEKIDDEEIGGISYEELAEIDLDALDHLDDTGLLKYFGDLASRASEGQLREAMAMPHDSPVVDFEVLVNAYALRRQKIALKLRSLRG